MAAVAAAALQLEEERQVAALDLAVERTGDEAKSPWLDADAFSVFKQKGIFNREVAASFREQILSKGGTEHPMVLYRRFRGQEPTIEALLRRNGIITGDK